MFISLHSRGITAVAALAVAGATLVTGSTPASAAGATQSGGVLTIVGTSNPDFIEIDKRPNGTVEVRNAPGIAQGTLFTGVTELRIYTGSDPDTIDLLIESSLKVYADTSTNSDTVTAEVLAGSSGTVIVDLFADTSTNSDTVEVKANSLGANLDLTVTHDMSTNDDKVYVEVNGEGRAQWLKAKLRTRSAVSNDVMGMAVTSDATNVFVDMGADIQYSTAEWNYGTPYIQPTVEANLIVDHKAPAGTLTASLSTASPKVNVELKGSTTRKVVNGRVTGSSRDDSLVVLAEGSASGNLITDGSYGYDVCNTNVGQRISCESF